MIAALGVPQDALTPLEEALSFFRSQGNRFGLGGALIGLAAVHGLLGQYQAGRVAYREALALFAEARNLPSMGGLFDVISTLESSAGRHAEAIRVMGAAAALRESTGASAPLLRMGQGDVQNIARQALGDVAVDEALAEGRRMTLEEAVDYASGLADAV